MTKEYITWQDVEIFVDQIAEAYADMPPAGVYGVPRGGLVLAVMISHRLAIPLLQAPFDNCLIVDDIINTGETIAHFDRMGYDIATLCLGAESTVKPKLFYKMREADWITYPWEYTQGSSIKDADDYFKAWEDK